jgi:hypothetical protein
MYWSGDFHVIMSNRFEHLHSSCLGRLPANNWDLTVQVCMEGSGTHGMHGGWNQPEHPPAWEQFHSC